MRAYPLIPRADEEMHIGNRSAALSVFHMRREMSGCIGLVGGIVDLWAGLSTLLQVPMGMNQMPNVRLIGYFLTALGVIVLVTGALMFVPRVMTRYTGVLMIMYGLVMLILAGGMLTGTFNLMMQWSSFSGVVMLVLGLAMLYSGSTMSRKTM